MEAMKYCNGEGRLPACFLKFSSSQSTA